ncbi:hypothetical protein ACFLXY_06110 [Chloroflexota bacterium]
MIQVEIVIKGYLDRGWSDWFGGFGITHAGGDSVLKGPVRDQSELRGILSHLADLGLELISVNTSSGSRVPERPLRGGIEYKTNSSNLRPKRDQA